MLIVNQELLSGEVQSPPHADALYRALSLRFGGTGGRNDLDSNETITEPNEPESPPKYTTIPRSFGAAPPASQASINRATTIASPPVVLPRRPPPPVPSRIRTVVALYDYKAEREGDLSFAAGDIIEVVKSTTSADDWWTGRCKGNQGIFPANYVKH